MPARRMLAVAALALSCALPAHADEGVGVNTQFAGTITSSSEALVGGSANSVGAEQVVTGCTYAGQTTLTGAVQYQVVAWVVASSTSLSQPQVTSVTCTLTSPAQGMPGELPTRSTTVAASCPWPACVAVGTVTGWPVRPVVVCTDGHAVFGPTPLKFVYAIHACKTSTL